MHKVEKLFSAYPYFSHGNILVKDDQTFEKPAMTLFLLSVYFFAIVDHFESRQYLTWRWTSLGRSRSRRIKASSTVMSHPSPPLLLPAIKILSLLFLGKSRYGEDRHIELQVQQQAGSP